MNGLRVPIGTYLNSTLQMLNISQADESIRTSLAGKNFMEPHHRTGMERWLEANQLTTVFNTAGAQQKEKRMVFEGEWAKIFKIYMKTYKIARSLCKGNAQKKAVLKLDIPRKRGFALIIKQAQEFYADVLNDSDILKAFAAFGISQETLKAEGVLIDNINHAKEAHLMAMGNTQAARVNRDKALIQLQKWIKIFSIILNTALADNPQHLEKVRIKAYSDGYKPKPKTKTETKTKPLPLAVDYPVKVSVKRIGGIDGALVEAGHIETEGQEVLDRKSKNLRSFYKSDSPKGRRRQHLHCRPFHTLPESIHTFF